MATLPTDVINKGIISRLLALIGWNRMGSEDLPTLPTDVINKEILPILPARTLIGSDRMGSEDMATLPTLPADVINKEILPKLPVRTLIGSDRMGSEDMATLPTDVINKEILPRLPARTLIGSDRMRSEDMATLPTLPTDVINKEILPILPARTLRRCKCVCKEWKDLISSPSFIKLHLSHSQQPYSSHHHGLLILNNENLTLDVYHLGSLESPPLCFHVPPAFLSSEQWEVFTVGSCNGLLCLANPAAYKFLLVNLITGVMYQTPWFGFGTASHKVSFGFGFDSLRDDYKVVGLVDTVVDKHVTCREVVAYSLLTHCWRLVLKVTSNSSYGGKEEDMGCFKNHGKSVVVDNHLFHWTVWCSSSNKHRIPCFDIETESWMPDVPLPDYDDSQGENVPNPPRDKEKDLIHLGVLEGCLCLLTQNQRHPVVDVWVMKEYGLKQSWTKLLGVSDSCITKFLRLAPFACNNDGSNPLLLVGKQIRGWERYARPKWYDMKNKKVVRLPKKLDSCFNEVYVIGGSLVPIRGGCQVGEKNEQWRNNARRPPRMYSDQYVTV